MTDAESPVWDGKRTDETRTVEAVLRAAGFERVDAYRCNSASIRVHVIDPRFEGLAVEERDALVEPHIERLPERTRADPGGHHFPVHDRPERDDVPAGRAPRVLLERRIRRAQPVDAVSATG